MKVICVDSKRSKQLFVGTEYEVSRIYFRAFFNDFRIDIVGLSHSFELYQFKHLDGSKIQEREYTLNERNFPNMDTPNGTLLMCINKNLKSVNIGRYYNLKSKMPRYDFSGNIKGIESVRVEGVDIYLSPYNFVIVPPDKLRELELGDLLDGTKEIEKLKENKPFERTDEEKTFDMLKSVVDAYNFKKRTKIEGIPIIEIMKKRTFEKHNLSVEDLEFLKKIDWDKLITE